MQLNFEHNWPSLGPDTIALTVGTINFVPIYVNDSLSWKTLNVGMFRTVLLSGSLSLSAGLYSRTGATLTLLNSISGTFSHTTDNNNRFGYVSLAVTSATSNILRGQYWIGLLISTTASATSLVPYLYYGVARMASGAGAITAQWPSFVQGRLTSVSTNALPASLLTSDLDQTNISMASPTILLTA